MNQIEAIKRKYNYTDGWMDRWIDGQMDRWMDEGWMDEGWMKDG